MTAGRPPVDPGMKEAALLAHVRRIARMRGWLIYHTHRSDRSEPGWPDLVLAHPVTGRFLVVELKTTKGHLSPAQQQWLDVLARCRIDARVWRPADLENGEIDQALNPHRPATPGVPS